MKLRLIDQGCSGFNPDNQSDNPTSRLGVYINPEARMTIPAREEIERVSDIQRGRWGRYFFSIPPQGVVAVLAPVLTGSQFLAIAYRLESEEPFPGEQPNSDMWVEALLKACPKCGHVLIWYEAGYVPGYRICAGPEHHHYIIQAED